MSAFMNEVCAAMYLKLRSDAHLSRILFVQLPRQCPAGAPSISGMVKVHPLFPLIPGQCNFGRIDNYDVISAII